MPDGFFKETDLDRELLEMEKYTFMKLEYLLNGINKTYNEPLRRSELINENLFSKKTKLGFDKIYVINLERRGDRRMRISESLNALNVEFKIFNAIDAKKMDDNYINSLGIKLVPDYTDPYHERPLNFGEIGCFLSHYFIWKEVCLNEMFMKVFI